MPLQLVEALPEQLRKREESNPSGYDDLARGIVGVLVREPRASVRAIATAIGASRAAVQQRLDWLRTRGLLNIVARTEALPASTVGRYNATFGLKVAPASLEAVAAALAATDGLHAASRIAGRFDFVASCGRSSLGDLGAVADRVLARLPGVTSLEPFVVMPVDGLQDAARNEIARAPAHLDEARSLDDLDRAILAELAHDGRRPYSEIAKRLGVPLSTVHHRVTTAERSGAIRFVTFVASEFVGLGVEAYLALELRGTGIRHAIERLRGLDVIQSLRKVSGRFTLLAYAGFPNPAAMAAFLEEHVEPLPDLERHEVWSVLQALRRVGRDVLHPATRGGTAPPSA